MKILNYLYNKINNHKKSYSKKTIIKKAIKKYNHTGLTMVVSFKPEQEHILKKMGFKIIKTKK